MKIPPDFLELSRRVGAEPLLVQGPGGNTSIKYGRKMWIKASGTELADALEKNIFVEVDCDLAIAEIDGVGDGSCRAALVDQFSTLRPSIETAFHALLPFRFVVHVHSIATICHAASGEGGELLAAKLAGLDWALVPYQRPGVPLTRAIGEVMGSPAAKVYVLKNHGLIVCGESVEEADSLLQEVERRLHLPARRVDSGNAISTLPIGWSNRVENAFLACDETASSRARAASYYPDHVVFLGPALPVIAEDRMEAYVNSEPAFPVVLVEGTGTLVRNDIRPSALAMLECLQNVLCRVPADWTMTGLSKSDEMSLLNWDAEKYRQALAAANGNE